MRRSASCIVVAAGVVGLSLHSVFVAPGTGARGAAARELAAGAVQAELPAGSAAEEFVSSSPWDGAVRMLAGVALGAALLAASAGPALADVDDVLVPVDGKGKTVMLTKEGLNRGKRLFNNACATCHVGGGTRTNQNVGLGIEELKGSTPPRDNIESLVDYQNNPTTYDGLKDISEVHPSIRGADIWPKMQSMKQSDLYDISAYMLYMTATIPEKWGGGKQYY